MTYVTCWSVIVTAAIFKALSYRSGRKTSLRMLGKSRIASAGIPSNDISRISVALSTDLKKRWWKCSRTRTWVLRLKSGIELTVFYSILFPGNFQPHLFRDGFSTSHPVLQNTGFFSHETVPTLTLIKASTDRVENGQPSILHDGCRVNN